MLIKKRVYDTSEKSPIYKESHIKFVRIKEFIYRQTKKSVSHVGFTVMVVIG